jgi:F0F1-type ATP synthase membrane subunit b/b'
VALEQGRANGQKEYERLVQAAREEVAAECSRARQELVSRLDVLVVSAAERVLGNSVDLSQHRELIREAVSVAERAAPGGQGS